MTVEQAMVDRLLGVPGLTALVGDRITPHVRDQDPAAVPALTYQVLSADDNVSNDGYDGTGKVSMQIDAWSATPDEALTVAGAVRDALYSFAGPGLVAFRKNRSGPAQDDSVLPSIIFRVRSVYDVHYAEGVAA